MKPLEGVTIVSAGGLGPISHCCMVLADMGADVLRVERPAASAGPMPPGLTSPVDIMRRGQRQIGLDLKNPVDVGHLLDLAADADVLLEGFRPGVMERLGLGPADCAARNPGLIYGRLTGWGQDGPLAQRAGHDINYIALTGALHLIGAEGGPPVPPLNLLGDYAGASLYMASGVLAALIQKGRTGKGCVIDGAIVDGVSHMMAQLREVEPYGAYDLERGSNLLDGGAPFYGVYRCADDGFVAVGAIEPHFFAELLELLGLDPADFDPLAADRWKAERARVAQAFRSRARDDWIALAGDRNVCLTPVLSIRESCEDGHLLARGTLERRDGVWQPGAAPRFIALTPGD